MSSWKSVPILVCDEPLVACYGPRLTVRSAYRQIGYREALTDVWLRAGVAERVNVAAGLLPDGLRLLLWDGWRPPQLQGRLYDTYRQDIARATGLTGDALDAETQRFVSRPSVDEACPAPHLTGGSIDLTLADGDGQPLDMGGEFDELSERSATGHYERDGLTVAQRTIRDRRRLLCSVMAHAGFSNYPEEWWHFDCANQWHHARVGGPARYGAVQELPRDSRSLTSQPLADLGDLAAQAAPPADVR